MRYILAAAIAACSLVPGMSVAQEREGITVEARQPHVAQWTAKISNDLEASLRSSMRFPFNRPVGIVSVAFRCNEDGKPTAIEVARKSGQPKLDAIGVRAVSRLKSLHPMPREIAHDRAFRADIAIAETEYDLNRMLAKFHKEQRQGRATTPTEVVVINIGVRGAG